MPFIFVPVMLWNSSAARKMAAPAPLWPKVISPGFSLSKAINSATDLAGMAGWTTSASGVRNSSATACKSLSGSKGMLLTSVGLAASGLARARRARPSGGAVATAGGAGWAPRPRPRRARGALDREGLAQPFLQPGGHGAHPHVKAAAGREGDDEGDRSRRKLLCEAAAGERKQARQRGRDQDGTTCDHCSFPQPMPGRLYRPFAGDTPQRRMRDGDFTATAALCLDARSAKGARP